MDKVEFFEICKKSGLKVNKGVCTTFVKRYNTLIYSNLRLEYLHRMSEYVRSASNIAQSARMFGWDDTNVLGGVIPHDLGITHVTVKGLFDTLGIELKRIHQIVDGTLKHSVQEPMILGIKYENEHFVPTWQTLASVSTGEINDRTLFPSLIPNSKEKRVQSDEIMFLLHFWLEHGGRCSFSASSRFASFCSKCLTTVNGTHISTHTLEKRYHNMNLPELCKLIFK